MIEFFYPINTIYYTTIIVAIIAFIRVKKKGTCGCGKEDCECCSSKHKHDK